MGIKQRPLIQDVVNRWGSTRVSTESILNHKDDQKELPVSAVFGHELEGFMNAGAINEALKMHKFKEKEKLQDYLLSRIDMMRIKHLNSFLTKFDISSTTLGGTKFVTASIVLPMMKSIQKKLQPSEDDPSYIANMKKLIMEDFKDRTKKILNFPFLAKASALDPRVRKLKFVEDKSKRDKVSKLLEEEAKEHLKEIAQADQKKPEFEQIVKKRKLGLDYDESDDTSDSDSEEDAIKCELENYRAEPEMSKDEEDIMSWWRFNRVNYPNLARLARLVQVVKCV